MKVTDWKAMQVAIVVIDKKPVQPKPGGIKTRYLTMGSWHADLTKHGARRPK